MSLIETREEVTANAFTFVDAVHDRELSQGDASGLVAAGRVFLPIRYGNQLAFAPAKFIGYKNNNIQEYKGSVYERSGSKARTAISRTFGYDAEEDPVLEKQLDNYCIRIGVDLHDHRHSFWRSTSTRRFTRNDRLAIHDIVGDDIGNEDPEYRTRMAGVYIRDDRVRKNVLVRAGGMCEYKKCQPFSKANGETYLETHHIISLSKSGVDKPSNVIALCPNHHREAHFGNNWKALQDEFVRILDSIGR